MGLGYADVFTQLGGWPVMPQGWTTANQLAMNTGHSVPAFFLPTSNYLIYANPNGTVGRSKTPGDLAATAAADPYFVSPGDETWFASLYTADVRQATQDYAGAHTGVTDVQTGAEFQAQLEAFGQGTAPSPIPGLYYTQSGQLAYSSTPAAVATVPATAAGLVVPVSTPSVSTVPTVLTTVAPSAAAVTTVTPTGALVTTPVAAATQAAASATGIPATIFGINSTYVLVGGAALVLLLLMGGKK